MSDSARLPLLVGEANPYGADPHYALYPHPERSAGGRLCRVVLGLPVGAYMRSFDRVNLCARKWSVPEARRAAAALVLADNRRIFILLGSKVCGAFGLDFEPYRIRREPGGIPAVFVVLPHPSGLCRLWNEPGAIERARAVLREAGAL